MSVEQEVADHYGHGALERAILEALGAGGKDVDRLAAADLAAVDELHFGRRPATEALAQDLAFSPEMHVLDVGAGIGGPARYLAESSGCRVTGVDLTDEFVRVAGALTRRCGLADRVSFERASALSLPFADATFDGATLIHVGMNIEDKAAAFAELRRVLKPGARLGVYDVMRIGDGDLPYPLPWAMSAATSFVERPEAYRRLLAGSGFAVELERDRSEIALRLARESREAVAQHGAPPLGAHIVMGATAPERQANAMGALERGIIAPIEIVARVC